MHIFNFMRLSFLCGHLNNLRRMCKVIKKTPGFVTFSLFCFVFSFSALSSLPFLVIVTAPPGLGGGRTKNGPSTCLRLSREVYTGHRAQGDGANSWPDATEI